MVIWDFFSDDIAIIEIEFRWYDDIGVTDDTKFDNFCIIKNCFYCDTSQKLVMNRDIISKDVRNTYMILILPKLSSNIVILSDFLWRYSNPPWEGLSSTQRVESSLYFLSHFSYSSSSKVRSWCTDADKNLPMTANTTVIFSGDNTTIKVLEKIDHLFTAFTTYNKLSKIQFKGRYHVDIDTSWA